MRDNNGGGYVQRAVDMVGVGRNRVSYRGPSSSAVFLETSVGNSSISGRAALN
jgi:hypothetical protein